MFEEINEAQKCSLDYVNGYIPVLLNVTAIAHVVHYSGMYYNERCYNETMIQRTVFINKIRMLQRMRRNIIYYGNFDYNFH